MRNKLLSLVAGGLASIGAWAVPTTPVAADEPRTPVVPVQTAVNTDSGATVQLVDHRRYRRGYRRGYYDGYYGGYRSYGYGGYYAPRYRYYNYPRYYYPYGGVYTTSYYDPYYSYPSGGIYFTW